MPCDKLAFQYALQICYGIDRQKGPRIVWLKNTLRLDIFYISVALVEEVKKNKDIEILSEPRDILFDRDGNVIEHDFAENSGAPSQLPEKIPSGRK